MSSLQDTVREIYPSVIKVPYSAAETTTKVSEPENGPKIFVSRPHPITLADLSTFLRVVVSICLSMLF